MTGTENTIKGDTGLHSHPVSHVTSVTNVTWRHVMSRSHNPERLSYISSQSCIYWTNGSYLNSQASRYQGPGKCQPWFAKSPALMHSGDKTAKINRAVSHQHFNQLIPSHPEWRLASICEICRVMPFSLLIFNLDNCSCSTLIINCKPW